MDLILPVDSVIDFLLDNTDEERLLHQFLEILKTIKEFNFAIQVFNRQSEVSILESLRTIDSKEEKTVLPTQQNKEMMKIFICQCVGIIVRKISDLLFYCNDKPRAYFLERFDSPSLAEIVILALLSSKRTWLPKMSSKSC
jgi:hypothetical protein